MKTQEEMRTEIISKAVDNDAFRARLLENPKEAVQEALGVTVPDAFTIQVHEGERDGRTPGAAVQRPVERC